MSTATKERLWKRRVQEVAESEIEKCLRLIQESAEKCRKLERSALNLKSAYAAAKKVWEGAAGEHMRLCGPDAWENGLGASANGQALAKPAEDESWKTVPIKEALPGLSQNIIWRMEEAELRTLGELSAYTGDGKHTLTDIPGVGKAKAEMIEKALEWYWQKRKEAGQALQEATTEEAAEEPEADEEDE
jgi:hypothetical protein